MQKLPYLPDLYLLINNTTHLHQNTKRKWCQQMPYDLLLHIVHLLEKFRTISYIKFSIFVPRCLRCATRRVIMTSWPNGFSYPKHKAILHAT